MLSRRRFSGYSLAALVTGAPLLKSSVSAALLDVTSQKPFLGNPNVTISAVDTTEGIVCQRTRGQTPCFIHVAASAIRCTGTNASGNPVLSCEDLEYSWNFGDTSGNEIFRRPTDGTIVNANTDQVGPEAAYCYRSAGNYTVTLRVRYWNGTAYVSKEITRQIIVTAYSSSGGVRYVDQLNGNSSWDGTAPRFVGGTRGPKATIADINSLIAANRQILIAEGSHFVDTVGINIPNSNNHPLRIGTYVGASGAGAKPILEMKGSGVALQLNTPGNNGTKSDIVFSNLYFTNSGASTAGAFVVSIGSIPGTMHFDNIYFDGCDLVNTLNIPNFTNFATNVKAAGGGTYEGWGLWRCALTGPNFPQTGANASVTGGSYFGGPPDWNFLFGCTLSGSGPKGDSIGLVHHVYPECQNHSLYKWVTFGESGTPGTNSQRNYCINTNSQGAGPFSQYQLISECLMGGTRRLFDMSDVNNNGALASPFKNFVCERCAHNTSQGSGITPTGAVSLTLRDNRIFLSNGGSWVNPSGNLSGTFFLQAYRNKFYFTSSETQSPIQIAVSSQRVSFRGGSPIIAGAGLTIPVGGSVLFKAGSVPSPFTLNTIYFVVATVAFASIIVAATRDGMPIVAGADGSGELTQIWTTAQSITDNVIWDERTSPSFMNLSKIIDFGPGNNKSLIDRNQYYGPNAKTKPAWWFDNSASSPLLYSLWSAPPLRFDTNAIFANPGWKTPVMQWSDMGP